MNESDGSDVSAKRLLKGNEFSINDSFDTIMNSILGYTMIGPTVLQVIYEIATMVKLMPGDVAEAGVCKGGTMYLIASILQDKVIHGFDSWEGLPEPCDKDIGHIMGKGWGKVEVPYEYLSCFGERIKLHKGWFEDTFQEVANKEFCLVHCDADHYSSVKTCMDFFIPRMVSGGFIICDDYGFHLTPGATLAVDEVIRDCGRSYKYYTLGNLVLRFD